MVVIIFIFSFPLLYLITSHPLSLFLIALGAHIPEVGRAQVHWPVKLSSPLVCPFFCSCLHVPGVQDTYCQRRPPTNFDLPLFLHHHLFSLSPSVLHNTSPTHGHTLNSFALTIRTAAGHALSTTIMANTTGSQWTFILAVTACFLSAVVILQTLTAFSKAYVAAPAEILTFVDAADSSVHENESYDRDVSRVQRLEDKRRLGRLLREVQKGGDDLREELNGLLQTDSGDLASDGYSDLRDLRLRAPARLLWASKRKGLEDKLRRLDMLRMRFLVTYMGINVSMGTAAATAADHHHHPRLERKSSMRDSEKSPLSEVYPSRPSLPSGMGEAIKKQRSMLRRLSIQPGRNSEKVVKKPGWADVIRELQLSPLLHKRHASIERAMSERSESPAPSMISEPPTPPGPAPIL